MRWTEKQLAEWQERHGVSVPFTPPDVSTQPFRHTAIVIDLPPPVSVNRIWRKTKSGMIKSTAYDRWIKRADALLLEMGQLKGVRTIEGKFTALIVVRRSNLDLDNNAKCVLDFLQSRRFISNDKHCEEVTLRWGDAPAGARVTVRACA
jgi:Holliday junction resolvase RusA-like endonuclease